MRLHTGQPAPLFDVPDIYGQRVRLADYANRKVYISFHRAAACPLCNLRNHLLMERYLDYARHGLRHISFWEATAEQLHYYLDPMRPPFPIIADPERRIYGQYGLESSLLAPVRARFSRGADLREARRQGLGTHWLSSIFSAPGAAGRLPGDFLISPNLRIARAHYGRDAGDFLMFAEIDAFVVPARVNAV